MTTRSLRTVGVAAAVAALAATALGTTGAHAVPAADKSKEQITLVGSDTTQYVMEDLASIWNTSDATNSDKDNALNVYAFGGANELADSTDPNCTAAQWGSGATFTWVKSPNVAGAGDRQAPNGSGAGKTALKASVTAGDGCVDVARSSSGRGATDPATFEYYAYARDAITWAYFKKADGTQNAPKTITLTPSQVKAIYLGNCSTAAGGAQNWKTYGGLDAKIVPYLPQAGSGSRSFFISNFLGGVDPTTGPCASSIKLMEEHQGTTIATADRDYAIAPFSAGQWIAQANHTLTGTPAQIVDNRAGILLGKVKQMNADTPACTLATQPKTYTAISGGPTASNPNAPYSASAATFGEITDGLGTFKNCFVGARYVYNVLDNTSASYNDAKRFVGFDATGNGSVCADTATKTNADGTKTKLYSTAIKNQGFLPLTQVQGVKSFPTSVLSTTAPTVTQPYALVGSKAYKSGCRLG